MEMLCIAAGHDPIGYVAVAGRGLDETAIAQMTGGSESEVRALLAELEQNGVFSRDRKGTIYSRRMVQDAKRSAISRKNGKEGGNPSLSKQSDISIRDNPHDNLSLKPHIPRAKRQNPKINMDVDGFTEFWEAYPRKTDRGHALKAYLSALRKASRETILSGALRYARERSGEDVKFTKHAKTWLNGECWADGDMAPANEKSQPSLFQGKAAPKREDGESDWHWRVRRFKETDGKIWLSTDGPPPTDRDCLAPAAILAEFSFSPSASGTAP
jgi:hypothetical protein